MRWFRLRDPRVLVWLILAFTLAELSAGLAGLVLADHNMAMPHQTVRADGARPLPAADRPLPQRESPPDQSLVPATIAAAGVTTVASDTPGVALAFTKTAEPAQVRPGHVVIYTLRVTNENETAFSGLRFTDPLPQGVVYVPGSASAGQYDPQIRELTWDLPDLAAGDTATLRFHVRATGQSPNPLINTARLSHAGWSQPRTTGATTHVLHAAEWVVLPDAAAQLAVPGGRVTLSVPAGAVAEPARFAYRSLDARPLTSGRTGTSAPLSTGLALQFEFMAHSAAAGEPITRFQQPLRLTIDLTDLLDVKALGPYKTWFVGYQDETTDRWVPLPVVDYQPGPVITVETDHFTPFGAGVTGVENWGWAPTFNDAQVALFDGAFAYNYPIQVPAGRAGLTPALNLSYNSRRVDGVISWIQPDWVGLGWSIDSVEIVRQGVRRCTDYPDTICYQNKFTLVINGTANELKPATAGQTYGRYHTADEQFHYIEWLDDGSATGGYWIVRARGGTVYELGRTEEARQLFGPHGLDRNGDGRRGDEPPINGLTAYRWRVNQVTDPHDNQIVYRYDYDQQVGIEQETKANQCSDAELTQGHACFGSLADTSQRAHYLHTIEYNHLDDGTPGMKIVFRLARRGSDVADLTAPIAYGQTGMPLAVFWQRYHLQSIQVWGWDAPTQAHVMLREYRLNYREQSQPCWAENCSHKNNHTRLLDSITQYGTGGYQAGAGSGLPATTFDYAIMPNKGKNANTAAPPWEQEYFLYDRLAEVDNGYGGVITTTYQTPDGGHWQAWNYRVSQRWTKDRGTATRQVEYAYPELKADRCYDNAADGDVDVCDFFNDADQWDVSGGRLVGYKTVTETLKTGTGGNVSVTEHDFRLRDVISPTFALGREVETRVIDPAGPTPLRTVQRTYTDDTAGRPDGVHFIRLDQVDTYAGDTTAPHTRTDYSYDAYGNTTRVVEYGNVNVAGDERTTHYRYYPRDDGTLYIVDRVARASVYAGEHPTDDDDLNTLQARTRYHYDLLDPNDPLSDPQAWTDSPTQGLLTQVDAWNGGLTGTDGDYSITGYRYDDWGNHERAIDPLSRTTTTDYDTLFHTYPITQTDALGQTTVTRYYGVDGAPATGEGASFGRTEAVTDPNGATTRYTYDEFGRLETIRRPGDEAPAPATVQYTYLDDPPPAALPLRIQVDRRQDASTVRTSYRFYDGLGRLIETKAPLPGNQQAVQHTAYDAQGLVAEEYVPYYTTTVGSAYVPVDTSKPKTSYTHDALGRVKQVAQPDGTGTTYVYGVEQNDAGPDFAGGREVVYVVDANQHFVRRSLDAYGRLQTVSEATGTYPNWGQEHRTRYAYDVQDHLTDVWDAANNHTHIDYDPLGRKTAMDDPDMGQWAYEYDAAGSLIKQRDARDQAICFYYDSLDRLVGKTYHAGVTDLDTLTCPGAPYAVRYTYDQGANGVGRRTSMTDDSGYTSWSYDARGRVVTETKTIGALGTYTTTYGYDSQDQVVTTTYPDPSTGSGQVSEVVTTTYDIAGRPVTLTSSLGDTYVTEATYNPAGQLKSRSLGTNPALTTWWGYFGYSEADGTGDSFDDTRFGDQLLGRLARTCTGQSQATDCPAPPDGNAGAVQDLRYWYDAVGNVTAMRDYPNANQVQQFRYDSLDRLTDAWTEPAGVGVGDYITRTYAYNSIGDPTEFAGATYGYGQPSGIAPGAKPHAVTHVGGMQRYWYDANGNMITRTVGSATDSLTYDAENRLHSVTNTATGETVSFTYDGDGRRVLRDTATETTAYIGPHYELRFDKQPLVEDLDDDCRITVIDIMRVAAQWGAQGPNIPEDVNGDQIVDVGDVQQVAGKWRETCHVLAEVVKYYALGGQRIAMRKAGTLYYLFTDHLGSSNVSYRADGGDTRTQRYYPWGTIRPGPNNTLPTDYTFTGQKLDEPTGLMYYGARYYEQALGRFIQPDTIVPEPGIPQDLNRYGYARNNPLTYNDPSGHAVPPGAFRQWEVGLPSWAQSGLMRRALSVGCFFLSCHVDAERGVLKGPTPEEQITTAIQPMPMSVAGGVASNLADDVVDDVARAGAKKVEQRVLPGFEDLVFRVEQAIRSEIRPAGKLLGRHVPDTEVHHLIEQRFARRLGVNPNDIPSVRLDKTFHQQEVTARLFQRGNLPTYPPRQYDPQKIWNTYAKVYGDLGRQDWLDAIWPYFERLGVVR